jgi:hypothetical protein
MNSRTAGVPTIVFQDAATGESRCVNGLHVQTFVANPFGTGTLLTLVNGDTVMLVDPFDVVVDAFMSSRLDG